MFVEGANLEKAVWEERLSSKEPEESGDDSAHQDCAKQEKLRDGQACQAERDEADGDHDCIEFARELRDAEWTGMRRCAVVLHASIIRLNRSSGRLFLASQSFQKLRARSCCSIYFRASPCTQGRRRGGTIALR